MSEEEKEHKISIQEMNEAKKYLRKGQKHLNHMIDKMVDKLNEKEEDDAKDEKKGENENNKIEKIKEFCGCAIV